MAGSAFVYYGAWINWTRGAVNGATITLSAQNSGIMVAGLAIWLSIAGGSLWRILAMAFHHQRTTRNPRDGLHYQQQVILRNATTPGTALWQFISLFSWRKLTRRPIWRSFPLIITAFVILAVFFLSGVLVSEVTRTTGSEVLIRSDQCGNWTIDATSVLRIQTKLLNGTITAASYARSCYGGASKALECNRYEIQSLPYTTSDDDACPFADGICRSDVFSLDTGKISSNDHLGINSKPDDRITYQRKTSCTVLDVENYRFMLNYTAAQDSHFRSGNNVTFTYNLRSSTVGHGYDLHSVDHSSGYSLEDNLWHPRDVLLRNDGDVSLMFLAANDILYYGEVADPMFNATIPMRSFMDNGKDITLYASTDYVTVMGCLDRHQFCNPTNEQCTKEYTAQSDATLYRVGFIAKLIRVDNIEKYCFTTGLSKIQRSIVEYATGPVNVLEGTSIAKPNTTEAQHLCNSQKIQVPPGSGAISFSTLGVALIIALSGLLIIGHLILECVVSRADSKDNYKLLRWAMDEKLQLQRQAFEGAGMGTWQAGRLVPVTASGELFQVHPDLHTNQKRKEMTVVGVEETRARPPHDDDDGPWSEEEFDQILAKQSDLA
ncbi:hypothetical protein K504DRAFT_535293 [Pleomassaria siparia CBS 279.74]|uniref:Uncharacterized protein n=1 Tax=Pleomassaria siparia CBS 279.74 TaxID=1314801 RepID=A0A6G1K4C4_9PLEO|nr:hypothetical protein K504DRAFT_535293 [Pleomassaria siparia CBS 279.74]